MLSRAPFVSVTLFFATGIWAGDALLAAFRMPVVSIWALLLFVGLACSVVYYFKLNSWFTVLLACWMVLLGVGCQWWTEAQKDAQRSALNALKYTSYTAEVTTLPEKRAHSVRFEVKAHAFQCADRWITHPVRALIYIPDSVTVLPRPGDRILVRGVLKQPEPPRNPAQFDYAQYLRNKGILFTAFTASYRLLPVSNAGSTAYWPETVSQWADERFRENLEDAAAYGLVKAMLLGRRDDLQTEQVGDYMISGAVHILSVSGMHVAIIFLAIGTAFGWLRRWRAGKWIYLALMLGLLAFYALVTGLPPSVQRAGLMCAVVVVAEVAGRKQHSMNTLAFSALIILLLDPCALYDVGFQLSYLAMAGIFLLYEPISGIFQPGNRVLKLLWQVTALALLLRLLLFR